MINNNKKPIEVFNAFDKRIGRLGVSEFDFSFASRHIRGRAYTRTQYIRKQLCPTDLYGLERLYYEILVYDNETKKTDENDMLLFYTELLERAFARSKSPISMEIYSEYEIEDMVIKTFNDKISVDHCTKEQLLLLLKITRELAIKHQVEIKENNRMEDDIFSVLKKYTGPLGVAHFNFNFDAETVNSEGYKALQAINAAITNDTDQYWYLSPRNTLDLSRPEMHKLYKKMLDRIISDNKITRPLKVYHNKDGKHLLIKSGMHKINASSSDINDLLALMIATREVAKRKNVCIKEKVLVPKY